MQQVGELLANASKLRQLFSGASHLLFILVIINPSKIIVTFYNCYPCHLSNNSCHPLWLSSSIRVKLLSPFVIVTLVLIPDPSVGILLDKPQCWLQSGSYNGSGWFSPSSSHHHHHYNSSKRSFLRSHVPLLKPHLYIRSGWLSPLSQQLQRITSNNIVKAIQSNSHNREQTNKEIQKATTNTSDILVISKTIGINSTPSEGCSGCLRRRSYPSLRRWAQLVGKVITIITISVITILIITVITIVISSSAP